MKNNLINDKKMSSVIKSLKSVGVDFERLNYESNIFHLFYLCELG